MTVNQLEVPIKGVGSLALHEEKAVPSLVLRVMDKHVGPASLARRETDGLIDLLNPKHLGRSCVAKFSTQS